jgi:N-acetylneuraminic acid mutarotase
MRTWIAPLLLVALCGCAAPPPAPWVRLADMPAGRAKFGVAALDDRLYVVGGYDTLKQVLVYDIAADRWQDGPPLLRGTDNVAALAAGGKVYAIGGEAGTAVQVLDPQSDRWTAGPALPTRRFAAAAAELGGHLHLVGGWNTSNAASASLASQEVFDLAAQRWLPAGAAPLQTPRNAAVAGVVDGKLVVAGGRAPGIRAGDQLPLAGTEIYAPADNRWAAGPPLPTPRGSLAAAVLNGRLYTFGGETAARAVSDAVERFDGQRWEVLPPLPEGAHGLGAVAHGGAIYVMGGFTGPSDAVGSESRALYRYTPPPD